MSDRDQHADPRRPQEVDSADSALPVLPGFREMALRRRREAVVADLAAHRRRTGLSQTEVAARMGTSQSTVARLEAGDVDPRLSTLERYAQAVGRTLDWRLGPPNVSDDPRSTTDLRSPTDPRSTTRDGGDHP